MKYHFRLPRFRLIKTFRLALGLVLALPLFGQGHWAYLPPQKVAIQSEGHPIDALLDNARKQSSLKANGLASPRDWLQRAAYTLTGLSPTAGQLDRLAASPDEATYRALIDEFLASPAYGERWARHWMDVARYSDTQGYNFDRDNRFPYAYTYRDWLVSAFNRDLPFDQFVQWQIAGDHLAKQADDPNLAALGFLTVGHRQGPVETIDDRVDVVTRGFLGTTVACARCHEHKSDPITTEDYYSLYSIFENMREPEEKPLIGEAADALAHEDFAKELAKLEGEELVQRQNLVKQVRDHESSAVYLELAWLAMRESWDHGRATSEAFKRGRYRPAVVIQWRDFLREKIAQGSARLQQWDAAMEPEASRKEISVVLAKDFASAEPESELGRLKAESGCPLAYDGGRVRKFFDTQDNIESAAIRSKIAALEADHPGSPPRAMTVKDVEKWAAAQVYVRGDPSNRSEPFERHWLSFLGGAVFPEGQSPRLTLAQRITESGNPLMARVFANRVWAWHFGQALTEPSDFGYDQPVPLQLALLDHLAIAFQESGYSLKALHRHILTSQAFRLSAEVSPMSNARDEGNTFYWRWTPRRLDFESMRDRILASSGALDLARQGGRSGKLEDAAMDSRRTLYASIDRYQLAPTLVSFDFPHPDLHASQRVETIVPQQSLYLFNGAGIIRQAQRLSASPSLTVLSNNGEKVEWIYRQLFQRSPTTGEKTIALDWLAAVEESDFAPPLSGYWEVRHAKVSRGQLSEEEVFPLLKDNAWKTGADLSKAPLPWIHASPESGHALSGHALILRFKATGQGQIRLHGRLQRSNPVGDELVWEIRDSGDQVLASGLLPPGSESAISSEFVSVQPGESLAFLLLAPKGHNTGSTRWDLQIEGREGDSGKSFNLTNFARDFPRSSGPPAPLSAGSPLADLIQMLWASNEFHFIY